MRPDQFLAQNIAEHSVCLRTYQCLVRQGSPGIYAVAIELSSDTAEVRSLQHQPFFTLRTRAISSSHNSRAISVAYREMYISAPEFRAFCGSIAGLAAPLSLQRPFLLNETMQGGGVPRRIIDALSNSVCQAPGLAARNWNGEGWHQAGLIRPLLRCCQSTSSTRCSSHRIGRGQALLNRSGVRVCEACAGSAPCRLCRSRAPERRASRCPNQSW